jgi:minor extracellular serine protease Vpr
MEGSRKQARRLLVVATAFATLASLTVASAGSAAKSPKPAGGELSSDYTPLAVSTEEVSVIVEVAGKPTALVEAAKGRDLSNAEEAQVKAGLERVQQPVEAAVERLGGDVLAEYQDALNGVRVDIARNKLDEVAQIQNVVDIHSVAIYDRPDNHNGVPLIGAPSVWQGLGGTPFRGEGIKIAVLDSGLDYTHANFGGPGTPAAFAAADANDKLAPVPGSFDPNKFKGGIDLVGDNYDASSDDPAKTTPVPDPNPLDCTSGTIDGHGSHVAGSATGFGVLLNGDTFTGPYNAATHTTNTFRIGPGVAPLADLYSVRLFGCSGSTGVTVEAIEWALDNDMDVLNMSLGSNYGASDDASAEASTNAARAGTIVVASAGNAGPAQYITGSPATGTGAISVAANDPVANLAAAFVSNPGFTGGQITAINANGATPVPAGPLDVAVLRTSYPNGPVSLGCDPDEYKPFDATTNPVGYPGGTAGKIVVSVRGVCARVARAIFAEQAGAAVAVMINNAASLPPFEGPITENPDDGTPFNVTIPFLGVRGVLGAADFADGDEFAALDDTVGEATTVNLAAATIANANFKGFASFTSGGPRFGDSHLKPNVTAPGQSILSTNMATGDQGSIKSGTSMAAPHTAGAAALVRQAHPSWSVQNIKAAIENTSSPADAGSSLTPFRISRGGSGLIQPLNAIKTHAVATGTQGTGAVSFGFDESTGNFSDSGEIQVENLGSSNVTFNVAAVMPQGSAHSILLGSSSVTVGPGSDRDVDFRLIVPVGTVGNSTAFREVAGFIQLTPVSPSMNNGVTLRVPYYFVPRADSNLRTDVDDTSLTPSQPSSAVEVTNTNGAITGNADFYAWGLQDRSEPQVLFNDLRAVGVQVFPSPTMADPTRRLLVFAVNYHERASSQSVTEIDILIDVNQDGTDDYALVGVDLGLATAGAFNGTYATVVFPINTVGDCVPDPPGTPPSVDPCPGTAAFVATAPTDSSTVLLPIRNTNFSVAALPSHPRMTQAMNPRFTYHAESFAFRAGQDDVGTGTAEFNAWNPSLSTVFASGPNAGQPGDFAFLTVPPGGTATTTVNVNAAEWAQTPQKGLMVVNLDDRSGSGEADLTSIRFGAGGGG